MKLLTGFGIRATMGGCRGMLEYAVVKRFFGSLIYDRIFKIAQPTPEHMKKNMAAYMRH